MMVYFKVSASLRFSFCFFALVLAAAQGMSQSTPEPWELLQQGEAAQKFGNLAQATAYYKQALEVQPQWAPAEYNLGLVALAQHNYSQAVMLFSLVVKHDPSMDVVYLPRGLAYYNLGEYRLALSSLQHFAKSNPTDPNVHFFLGTTYSALTDFQDAAQQYLEQIQLTPRRAEAYYELGESYISLAQKAANRLPGQRREKYFLWLITAQQQAQEGHMMQAEGQAQHAVKIDPDAPEAYVSLGSFYLSQGKWAEGKNQFEEALRRQPENCSALEGIGDIEIAAGKIDAGLAAYEEVLNKAWSGCLEEQPPRNLGLPASEFDSRLKSLQERAALAKWKVAASLALSRLEEKRSSGTPPNENAAPWWDEPRDSSQCTMRSRTGSQLSQGRTDLALADCLELAGDLPKSTSALAAAQRHEPEDAETSYWAFRIYMRLSQRVFTALAELAPHSYLLSEMRAESLELEGRNDEADSEYRMSIANSGGDANPLVQYGRFECTLNKFDEAIPILNRALLIAPNNPEANALMGQALFSTNQFKLALPYLAKALKLNPDDGQSRIYLGKSLGMTERIGEAISVLEAAPTDKDGRIHYLLGTYYRREGRTEAMKRAFKFFQERQAVMKSRAIVEGTE